MNNKDRREIKSALADARRGEQEMNDAENYDALIYQGWVEALEFALSLGENNDNRNKTNKRKKKKKLLSGRRKARRSKT